MSDVTVTLTYCPEEARRVAHLVRKIDRSTTLSYEDHDRLLLIASAITAQIPPPKPSKPPEPTGLGAVVEDADGTQWVRIQTDYSSPWLVRGAVNHPLHKHKWDSIAAVKVLSEGVTA